MSTYGEELYGGGLYGGPVSAEIDGDDTWTVIAGAITDTISQGPSVLTDPDGLPIDSPGYYVEPLSVEVVAIDDLDTVLTTLPKSFSRTFQDDANNTGSASLAITNLDEDIDEVTLDRLITYRVYGNKALTMLVESLHKVSAAAGEEYDQITIASGRGHLALLEKFVLYPSRGVDSVPVEEDRVFNWTTATYNDSGWKYARQIARHDRTVRPWTVGGEHAPLEFPDPYAYWIWASSGTPYWAKPGPCYFRMVFNVPAGCTQIAIYYAMDNRGKIYIDGIPFAEQDGGLEWRNTKYVTVDVTPGSHLIAIEAFNEPGPSIASSPPPAVPVTHTVVSGDTLWGIAQRYYGAGNQWRIIYDKNQAQIQADATTAGLWDPWDPGHWIFPGQVFTIPGINRPASGTPVYNPGGIMVAIYEQDEAPTRLLLRTTSSWKIAAYPAEPPGMSVGEVISRVKKEASRRGHGLADMISLKFSHTVDSAGKPWPIVADIASKVGTDYLTFLLELTAKYCDIWMAPGTLDLYAWNKGTRSKLRGVDLHHPTDPDDAESGNMFELTHTVLV